MSMLVLLAHAFNPLLLMVGIRQRSFPDDVRNGHLMEEVFTVVLSSFLLYLLWLSGHFAVHEMAGTRFDYEHFIGEGESIAYFLPFILGFVMLVIEFLVRPRLRTQKGLAFANAIKGLLLFSGCYFMFVNYLAWIVQST